VLVEALVVIAIVAATVVGLVGGLVTSARVSENNRERQRMQAALTSYGETLRGEPYWPCSFSNPTRPTSAVAGIYANNTAFPPLDRLTLSVQDVKILGPDGAWVDTCDAVSLQDSGVQLLTIRVDHAKPGRTASAQIVKREYQQ
jgi:type II secretory pathway pseudopilin PulG